MQVYLGNTPLDYRGIQLGDTNIQTIGFQPTADADAFISAAGITNPTQQSAITNLVASLQGAGLWNKMYAIYPFVGGNANSHKYNLKNPQDTDAAFRLTFYGNWTQNSNGITGNAFDTYAQTYLSPQALSINTNGSIGIYSRTNTAVGYDMGAYDIGTNQLGLICRYIDNKFYAGMPIDGVNTFSNSDSRGLFTACQTGGGNVTGYKNATQVINQSDSFVTSIVNPIYIGATYGGIDASASNRNYAFAFIGNTLSAAEVSAYYTIIQTFETALGRQV
jgi:hypothetical protein